VGDLAMTLTDDAAVPGPGFRYHHDFLLVLLDIEGRRMPLLGVRDEYLGRKAQQRDRPREHVDGVSASAPAPSSACRS
jgi:hypothetical protein